MCSQDRKFACRADFSVYPSDITFDIWKVMCKWNPEDGTNQHLLPHHRFEYG